MSFEHFPTDIIFSSKTDSVALSTVHLSPLGSQTSFSAAGQGRIENVADWEAIAKKYRALVGDEEERSIKDSDAESQGTDGSNTAGGVPPAQVGNNINANASGAMHV